MAIDSSLLVSFLGDATRLRHHKKYGVSRSLRRVLSQGLATNLTRPAGPSQLFQQVAFGGGYSPQQFNRLQEWAHELRGTQEKLLELEGVDCVHFEQLVVDEAFGLISNQYVFPNLETASLRELQQMLMAAIVLTEPILKFARNPNSVLADCPVYGYRGLACDITDDDTLWAVSGADLLSGGSGILEWCFDEEDAQLTLARMLKHPCQFEGLKAESFREAFSLGNVHPQVLERMATQA